MRHTQAPLHATLTYPRAAERQALGTDSLRSSDEFPANKENSHGRWHTFEGSTARAVKAVATAGGDVSDLVSEQVLAQEAVSALQVKSHLCLHKKLTHRPRLHFRFVTD